MCKVKFSFECTPGCAFRSHENFCVFKDSEIGCSNVMARTRALADLKKASQFDTVRSVRQRCHGQAVEIPN
jgi:hypothetical protein